MIGVLTYLIVSMFVKALIKYGHFELFVKARLIVIKNILFRERKIKSLEIAIELGIAVLAFFLGLIIVFLKSYVILYLGTLKY